MKTVTIPERDELLARLCAIDDDPHLVERLYPLLLKVAGQRRVGAGIAVHLALCAADYGTGQPHIMYTVMSMRLWIFIPAFTDDPDAQAEALAHLESSGLPVG